MRDQVFTCRTLEYLKANIRGYLHSDIILKQIDDKTYLYTVPGIDFVESRKIWTHNFKIWNFASNEAIELRKQLGGEL